MTGAPTSTRPAGPAGRVARTRVLVSIWVVGVLLAGSIAGASPAAAAEQLMLSRDGQHWSPSLQGTLFDDAHRWVPGDSTNVRFWVRNETGAPAELRMEVTDVRGTLVLGRDLTLTAELDGRAAAAGPLLIPPRSIAESPLAVDLIATVPSTAGNDTQRGWAGFRLRVGMTGDPGTLPSSITSSDPAPAPVRTPAPSSGHEGLAGTGAPSGLIVLVVLGIGSVGVAAVLRRRTDSRT